MTLANLQQIVEDELKSIQRNSTTKNACKKPIETVVQKDVVITMKNVRGTFQAKKKSELQKAETTAQRTINTSQKQEDLEYKK